MLAHRTTIFSVSKTAAARADAADAKRRGLDPIDLTAGEIWADLSPVIQMGAMEAIAAGANRYTDTIGLPELRHALAQKVSTETGEVFSRDEIAVTTGAKQALFNSAMVLLDPGDQVIIPSPYWGTFAAQARIAQATPIAVDTRVNRYVPRRCDIERVLTPLTRAIVVNTPNNPTGAVYDADTLAGIARLAIDNDLWVIFDECYGAFTHAGHQHHSILRLVPEVRSRAVIVNAFSKSLAMTGWRIGYLAAPARVVAAVRALQSHTTSNPNIIAQMAVYRHLVAGDRSYEDGLKARLSMARSVGLDALSQIARVSPPKAEGGFYIYLDLSHLLEAGQSHAATADDVARSLLAEAGVAAVSGTAFDDPFGLRISYGVDLACLREGCRRIAAHLNQWPTGRPDILTGDTRG